MGQPNDASKEEDAGGGITNRPLEEEKQEQSQLPPRGNRKDGSHA